MFEKPILAPHHEWNEKGIALRRAGKSAEALQCYDEAIKILPNYPEAHNNRGNALGDLGRSEEALLAYETALKINPSFPEAHENRGNLLHS